MRKSSLGQDGVNTVVAVKLKQVKLYVGLYGICRLW